MKRKHRLSKNQHPGAMVAPQQYQPALLPPPSCCSPGDHVKQTIRTIERKVVAVFEGHADIFYLLLLIGLASCYAVCRLRFFFNNGPPTPPPICGSCPHHVSGRHGAASYFFLCYVPPGSDPFGRPEDPPVPVARLLCCEHSQHGFNSQAPRGIIRGSYGGSKNVEVVSHGSQPVAWWPTQSRVLPTGYPREYYPTWYSPVVLPYDCPSK